MFVSLRLATTDIFEDGAGPVRDLAQVTRIEKKQVPLTRNALPRPWHLFFPIVLHVCLPALRLLT